MTPSITSKYSFTFIVRAVSLIAVVGGIVWALRPHPTLVETATVMRGAVETTVSAEAKTRVKNLFVVASPVDGELARIGLNAGDTVSPATVVARIWPAASRPLDSRTRAEAAAAVVAARAALERA